MTMTWLQEYVILQFEARASGTSQKAGDLAKEQSSSGERRRAARGSLMARSRIGYQRPYYLI